MSEDNDESVTMNPITEEQARRAAIALFRQGVKSEDVLTSEVRTQLEELERGRSRLLRCKRAQERLLVRR